ncbi:MAG: TolC family protein [Candidatus Cloacimonas sp.]|nr:TolC family protein [Candidatus Cloacimonadota bacterium]
MVRRKGLIHTWLFIGLMLTLFASGLYAEDREYNLDDLIEIGLEQATSYQIELLQKKNIHSNLISTYYSFLPSMMVSAGQNYSSVDTRSAGFSLYKGVSLNEPTYFNWRSAKYDQQIAELNFSNFRKKTVFEVFSYYIEVLEAEKRKEIQEKNLEIQVKISKQVETLFELQKKSAIDVKQSQIALINAQIAKESADNSVRQMREKLFHYLNIVDEGYRLKDPEVMVNDDDYEFEYSSDVLKDELNLKKSSLSLFQTKLDFLPRLSASYSYNYSYSSRSPSFDLFDFDKYEDSYTIGLSLSYSLLNPLEHRETYLRSKRSHRIQNMQHDKLRESNELQFSQKKRDWETEKQIYELAQKKFELAEESLEMAEEQFGLGLLSLLELDQARQNFMESEIDLTSRYYQLLIKQEELNLFLSRKILGRWE